MITLKRHYAISASIQTVSLVVLASAKAKNKTTGKLIFTPEGQKGIHMIGMGILVVGSVIHYAAHARLIGRGTKALYRVVKK